MEAQDAVRIERFSVDSTDGKTCLACRMWLPQDEPAVAAVQLVHGMAEHIGRYDAFARFLAAHGCAVVGHDHVGHGESRLPGAEPEATWGLLEPGRGAEVLVDDVSAVHGRASEALGDLPWGLFGHSMGSFVARVVSARYGSDYKAAVFCGTGWQKPVELVAGRALTSQIAHARGADARSSIIDGMAVGSYGRGFSGEEYPSIAWLSREIAVRADYEADPACGFMFSVGAYHELFRLIQMAQDRNVVAGTPQDLAVLIISGEHDPVGGAGAVASTAGLLRTCGVADVTERVYEGARHELLNETNAAEVMDDVASWLARKGIGR